MAPADQPFLRSPPFPWVDPGVAAVSVPGASRIVDPEALIAALREERTGGAFWSVDDPWTVDAPGIAAPDDDAAIVGWLSGRSVLDRAGQAFPGETIRAAALCRIGAAAYRDPFAAHSIDAIEAVRILGRWRRTIDANRGIEDAVGMAAWKREAIGQFLWSGGAATRFLSAAAALDRPGAVAYWPSRVPGGFVAAAAARDIPLVSIEDGFLRSNGLGAECRPPLSVIVDPTGGLYFDPERASALETILATHQFDDALLARAAALRTAIVAARLGKYGPDRGVAPAIRLPADRRIVLAVGQVEGDLSVLRGGAGVTDNAAFLSRVRAAEPDAAIVYRPHPDVAAGLRRGRLADPVAAGLCDHMVIGGSLLVLIERVDGVHVLSSLTGFEALLRGRDVTVHGQPFYAGWGLTRDLAEQPARRGRVLTLDALIAGALILAPRYRDPVTELPCEVETLVARLADAPVPGTTLVTGFRRAFGATRRTLSVATRAIAGGRA